MRSNLTYLTRRQLLRIAATLSGSALLAACGTAPPEQPADATAMLPADTPAAAAPATPAAAPTVADQRTAVAAVQSGKQKLVVARWALSDQFEAEDALFNKVLFPAFEQRHPEVEVELLSIWYYDAPGYDYYSKLFQLHEEGRAPDVQNHDAFRLGEVLRREMVLPLDDLLDEQNIDRADFVASALPALSRDGKLYALPQDIYLQGLYYNKTMFDEAGLPHPDDSYTLERLLKDAEMLTLREGDVVQRYGITPPYSYEWGDLVGMILNMGGAVWENPGTPGERPAPDETWAQALGAWKELIERGIAPNTEAASVQEFGGLFEQGRAAMVLHDSWFARFLMQREAGAKLDWAVAPFPGSGTSGAPKQCRANSSCWSLAAQSSQPKLAWELLQHLSSAESLLQSWQSFSFAPPARYSALSNPALRELPGLAAGGKSFDDTLGWMLTTLENKRDAQEWIGDHTPMLAKAMQNTIGSVLYKGQQLNIRKAIDEAVGQVNAQLQS